MSAVSDKVIAISKTYLGPATESFLTRQCKGHLKIDLADLATANLKDLAKWVQEGAGLIMDADKASQLAGKISSMT
jgi:hypothetical protein